MDRVRELEIIQTALKADIMRQRDSGELHREEFKQWYEDSQKVLKKVDKALWSAKAEPVKEGKWDVVSTYKSEDGHATSITLVDSEYENAKVYMKWDGCVDYRWYHNGATVYDKNTRSDDVDYIHICDINDMIERLQEIKKIAKENFREFDYAEYWED